MVDMKPLLCAAVLVLPALSAASLVQPQTPSPAVQSADAFDDLDEEFEEAREEWRERIQETKGARARRDLRRQDPVHAFWPRFEELESTGEIRALFWLLDHVQDSDVERSKRGALRLSLYEKLVGRYGDDPAFSEGLERMFADRRLVREAGPEALERLSQLALERSKTPQARATIQLRLALATQSSDDPEAVERALTELERLAASEHLAAADRELARRRVFAHRHLRVGCVAPDFEAADVDGVELSLSEFRGQVVLLDFFGFW